MLQQGIIKHIQTYQKGYFPTDNVIMMNVEFGMANQFSIDLSVNTKRGQRQKVQEGWLPHKAPIGYLNNKHNLPDLQPIYKDEERFFIIKKLWQILLKEHCSIEKIKKIADDIGLRNSSGKKLARSSYYELFKNPFYYGSFTWQGIVYEGKHEPMITKKEYDLAQAIIAGKNKPKGKDREFAFRGVLRCGECGAMITAEYKTKKQKNGNIHHYTYYRCTKRINPKCTQKTIREEKLEKQIVDVLDNITIPQEFHNWAIKYLKEEHEEEQESRNKIIISYQKALKACTNKIDTLFNMRLNEEIEAEEYSYQKNKLKEEKSKYEELLNDTNNRVFTWIDEAEKLLEFAEKAKERFENGDLKTKGKILSLLGSNLLLKNKVLSIKLNPVFEMLKKVAPEVRDLHLRLEPQKSIDNKGYVDSLNTEYKNWGMI
ncbi:MAG: hypothetical protein GY817_00685 [bacterium]|nr:hypothetical protein [bacterium]